MNLDSLINLNLHPIKDSNYNVSCKNEFNETGALVMEEFLDAETLKILQTEAHRIRHQAYFCYQNHNAFLLETDNDLPEKHIRNLNQVSDKGCVSHDQIPDSSPLRSLYECADFRQFLEFVLGTKIFPYADTLSSINVNYYEKGQQLGWHYDNASFAVTLMLQSPDRGGEFEYSVNLRDIEAGDYGYESTEALINGKIKPKTLSIGEGSLVLFKGSNSLHRVVPVISKKSRILVTLNFNTEPGLMLSELARMVFFGRLN